MLIDQPPHESNPEIDNPLATQSFDVAAAPSVSRTASHVEEPYIPPPNEIALTRMYDDTQRSIGLMVRTFIIQHPEQFDVPTPPRTASAGSMGKPPRRLSWQEHQAAADLAFETAEERRLLFSSEEGNDEDAEDKDPAIDETTHNLYEQASRHYNAASFSRPRSEGEPLSNIFRLASSLGWQAKATPVGVFIDEGGTRIDVKSNLQEIACKTLQYANDLVMGGSAQLTETLAGQLTENTPPEPFAKAAVEAAVEAGTGTHVVVRGIGKVDSETPEILENEDTETFNRFVGEHALDPQNGAGFSGVMGAILAERTRGSRSPSADRLAV